MLITIPVRCCEIGQCYIIIYKLPSMVPTKIFEATGVIITFVPCHPYFLRIPLGAISCYYDPGSNHGEICRSDFQTNKTSAQSKGTKQMGLVDDVTHCCYNNVYYNVHHRPSNNHNVMTSCIIYTLIYRTMAGSLLSSHLCPQG